MYNSKCEDDKALNCINHTETVRERDMKNIDSGALKQTVEDLHCK